MHSYRGEACACQQTARGTQPLTPTVWQPPWLWLAGQQAAVTRHRLPLCKKALQPTASGKNHMYKCRHNVSWSVSHCCELPLGELLSWHVPATQLEVGRHVAAWPEYGLGRFSLSFTTIWPSWCGCRCPLAARDTARCPSAVSVMHMHAQTSQPACPVHCAVARSSNPVGMNNIKFHRDWSVLSAAMQPAVV